ncbi:MAG: hypothetical protein LBL92_01160, partial [Propionibacteriaceae bacterium]|nr:hypothetical protein [Propionibacteriaceae bacterium]
MRNRSIRAGLAALAGFLALGLVIGTVWALWRQSLDLSNELSSTEPGSLARLCEPDATACTPTGAAATDYLDQATDSDWGLDGIEFTSTDAADFKQMVIADDEPFALLRSYTLYAATTGNRGLDYQVTIPTPEPDTWVENSVLRVWETSDSCVLNEAPSVQPTLGGTLIPAGYVDTSHQSTADPDAANKQATKTL